MNIVRLGSMAAYPDIPVSDLVLYASLDHPITGSLTGPTFGFVFITGGNDIQLQKNRFYMTPSVSESYDVWQSKLNTLSNTIGTGGTAFWYSFTDPDIGITNFGNCGYWYGGTGDYYFRLNLSNYGITQAYYDNDINALILEPINSLTTPNFQFLNCIKPDGSTFKNPEHKGVWGFSSKVESHRIGNTLIGGLIWLNDRTTPSYKTILGITGASGEGITYQNILCDSMYKCSSLTNFKAPITSCIFVLNSQQMWRFYEGITFYVVTDGIKNDSLSVTSPVPRGNTYWAYEGVTTGNTTGKSNFNSNKYFGLTSGFLKIKNIPFDSKSFTIIGWFYLDPYIDNWVLSDQYDAVSTILFSGYHTTRSSTDRMYCWPNIRYAPTRLFFNNPASVSYWNLLGKDLNSFNGRFVLGTCGGSWVMVACRFSDAGSLIFDSLQIINQYAMVGLKTNDINFFTSDGNYTAGIMTNFVSSPYSIWSLGACGWGLTGVMDLNIGIAYDYPILSETSTSGTGDGGKVFESKVGDLAIYNTYLSDQNIANFYATTVGKYVAKI